MGSEGLERALIGTVAACGFCKLSRQWLGQHSANEHIRRSGLWQVQHLSAGAMSDEEKRVFSRAVEGTRNWLKELSKQ
jgi:hypothetical protein